MPPVRRRGPVLMALVGAGLGSLLLAGLVLLGGEDEEAPPAEVSGVEVLKAPPGFVPIQEAEPATASEPTTSGESRASSRRTTTSRRSTSKGGQAEPQERKDAREVASEDSSTMAEPESASKPAAEAEPEEERPRLVQQLRGSLKAAYRVRGDALAVWLVDKAGGTFSADDEMPVGTYSIQARFESWDGVVDAGTVQLLPGATVTITCKEALLSCSK